LGLERLPSETLESNTHSHLRKTSACSANTAREESHLSSEGSTLSPISHLPGPKKLRGKPPDYRPELLEYTHSSTKIQNVKPQYLEETTPSASMACQHGPEPCLSSHSDKAQSPPISGLQLPQSAVLFQSTAIWSECSSTTIHQTSQISSITTSQTGHSDPCISGQHNPLGSIRNGSKDKYNHNSTNYSSHHSLIPKKEY